MGKTIVQLPCSIGSTVYEVYDKTIFPHKVIGFQMYEDDLYVIYMDDGGFERKIHSKRAYFSMEEAFRSGTN